MTHEFKFYNRAFDKSRLKALISWSVFSFGDKKTLDLLEKLKELGYTYATKAGISLSIDDLKIPASKKHYVGKAEQLLNRYYQQVKKGRLTSIEYFSKVIQTWNQVSENLKEEVIANFKKKDELNPVFIMAFSGARGNISQVRQLTSMRGLMSDPQGRIINFPIISNFREGLTLTEYLISCQGARKGVVDTALRTATSGYLTRRLIDVAHHVIIRGFDCETEEGIYLTDLKKGKNIILPLKNRLIGRRLAEDISNRQKQLLATRNQEINFALANLISKNQKAVLVRSPLTCKKKDFLCQLCYGWGLANRRLVSLNEAVGIIAAQSIGEPGTQLTMRTFHTGGVFSGEVVSEISAPFSGEVDFPKSIPGKLVQTPYGQTAFLTKQESFLFLTSAKNLSLSKKEKGGFPEKKGKPVLLSPKEEKAFLLRSKKLIQIPAYTLLFVKQNQGVEKDQILGEASLFLKGESSSMASSQIIYSEFSGQCRFGEGSSFRPPQKKLRLANRQTANKLLEPFSKDFYPGKRGEKIQKVKSSLGSFRDDFGPLGKPLQIDKDQLDSLLWEYGNLLTKRAFKRDSFQKKLKFRKIFKKLKSLRKNLLSLVSSGARSEFWIFAAQKQSLFFPTPFLNFLQKPWKKFAKYAKVRRMEDQGFASNFFTKLPRRGLAQGFFLPKTKTDLLKISPGGLQNPTFLSKEKKAAPNLTSPLWVRPGDFIHQKALLSLKREVSRSLNFPNLPLGVFQKPFSQVDVKFDRSKKGVRFYDFGKKNAFKTFAETKPSFLPFFTFNLEKAVFRKGQVFFKPRVCFLNQVTNKGFFNDKGFFHKAATPNFAWETIVFTKSLPRDGFPFQTGSPKDPWSQKGKDEDKDLNPRHRRLIWSQNREELIAILLKKLKVELEELSKSRGMIPKQILEKIAFDELEEGVQKADLLTLKNNEFPKDLSSQTNEKKSPSIILPMDEGQTLKKKNSLKRPGFFSVDLKAQNLIGFSPFFKTKTRGFIIQERRKLFFEAQFKTSTADFTPFKVFYVHIFKVKGEGLLFFPFFFKTKKKGKVEDFLKLFFVEHWSLFPILKSPDLTLFLLSFMLGFFKKDFLTFYYFWVGLFVFNNIQKIFLLRNLFWNKGFHQKFEKVWEGNPGNRLILNQKNLNQKIELFPWKIKTPGAKADTTTGKNFLTLKKVKLPGQKNLFPEKGKVFEALLFSKALFFNRKNRGVFKKSKVLNSNFSPGFPKNERVQKKTIKTPFLTSFFSHPQISWEKSRFYFARRLEKISFISSFFLAKNLNLQKNDVYLKEAFLLENRDKEKIWPFHRSKKKPLFPTREVFEDPGALVIDQRKVPDQKNRWFWFDEKSLLQEEEKIPKRKKTESKKEKHSFGPERVKNWESKKNRKKVCHPTDGKPAASALSKSELFFSLLKYFFFQNSKKSARFLIKSQKFNRLNDAPILNSLVTSVDFLEKQCLKKRGFWQKLKGFLVPTFSPQKFLKSQSGSLSSFFCFENFILESKLEKSCALIAGITRSSEKVFLRPTFSFKGGLPQKKKAVNLSQPRLFLSPFLSQKKKSKRDLFLEKKTQKRKKLFANSFFLFQKKAKEFFIQRGTKVGWPNSLLLSKEPLYSEVIWPKRKNYEQGRLDPRGFEKPSGGLKNFPGPMVKPSTKDGKLFQIKKGPFHFFLPGRKNEKVKKKYFFRLKKRFFFPPRKNTNFFLGFFLFSSQENSFPSFKISPFNAQIKKRMGRQLRLFENPFLMENGDQKKEKKREDELLKPKIFQKNLMRPFVARPWPAGLPILQTFSNKSFILLKKKPNLKKSPLQQWKRISGKKLVFLNSLFKKNKFHFFFLCENLILKNKKNLYGSVLPAFFESQKSKNAHPSFVFLSAKSVFARRLAFYTPFYANNLLGFTFIFEKSPVQAFKNFPPQTSNFILNPSSSGWPYFLAQPQNYFSKPDGGKKVKNFLNGDFSFGNYFTLTQCIPISFQKSFLELENFYDFWLMNLQTFFLGLLKKTSFVPRLSPKSRKKIKAHLNRVFSSFGPLYGGGRFVSQLSKKVNIPVSNLLLRVNYLQAFLFLDFAPKFSFLKKNRGGFFNAHPLPYSIQDFFNVFVKKLSPSKAFGAFILLSWPSLFKPRRTGLDFPLFFNLEKPLPKLKLQGFEKNFKQIKSKLIIFSAFSLKKPLLKKKGLGIFKNASAKKNFSQNLFIPHPSPTWKKRLERPWQNLSKPFIFSFGEKRQNPEDFQNSLKLEKKNFFNSLFASFLDLEKKDKAAIFALAQLLPANFYAAATWPYNSSQDLPRSNKKLFLFKKAYFLKVFVLYYAQSFHLFSKKILLKKKKKLKIRGDKFSRRTFRFDTFYKKPHLENLKLKPSWETKKNNQRTLSHYCRFYYFKVRPLPFFIDAFGFYFARKAELFNLPLKEQSFFALKNKIWLPQEKKDPPGFFIFISKLRQHYFAFFKNFKRSKGIQKRMTLLRSKSLYFNPNTRFQPKLLIFDKKRKPCFHSRRTYLSALKKPKKENYSPGGLKADSSLSFPFYEKQKKFAFFIKRTQILFLTQKATQYEQVSSKKLKVEVFSTFDKTKLVKKKLNIPAFDQQKKARKNFLFPFKDRLWSPRKARFFSGEFSNIFFGQKKIGGGNLIFLPPDSLRKRMLTGKNNWYASFLKLKKENERGPYEEKASPPRLQISWTRALPVFAPGPNLVKAPFSKLKGAPPKTFSKKAKKLLFWDRFSFKKRPAPFFAAFYEEIPSFAAFLSFSKAKKFFCLKNFELLNFPEPSNLFPFSFQILNESPFFFGFFFNGEGLKGALFKKNLKKTSFQVFQTLPKPFFHAQKAHKKSRRPIFQKALFPQGIYSTLKGEVFSIKSSRRFPYPDFLWRPKSSPEMYVLSDSDLLTFQTKPKPQKVGLLPFSIKSLQNRQTWGTYGARFFKTLKDDFKNRGQKLTWEPVSKKKPSWPFYIGHLVRPGKKIHANLGLPESGQIFFLQANKVVLRYAKPFLLPRGANYQFEEGDFVNRQVPLLTLKYRTLKTEDIVQGIPKIEQLFEAREKTQENLGLRTLLKNKYQGYKIFHSQPIAVRKSLEFIQHHLIQGIQKVYQSQGVNISDKHLEIIVKQMTSKVQIQKPAFSGLLPGDIVGLEKLEKLEKLNTFLQTHFQYPNRAPGSLFLSYERKLLHEKMRQNLSLMQKSRFWHQQIQTLEIQQEKVEIKGRNFEKGQRRHLLKNLDFFNRTERVFFESKAKQGRELEKKLILQRGLYSLNRKKRETLTQLKQLLQQLYFLGWEEWLLPRKVKAFSKIWTKYFCVQKKTLLEVFPKEAFFGPPSLKKLLQEKNREVKKIHRKLDLLEQLQFAEIEKKNYLMEFEKGLRDFEKRGFSSASYDSIPFQKSWPREIKKIYKEKQKQNTILRQLFKKLELTTESRDLESLFEAFKSLREELLFLQKALTLQVVGEHETSRDFRKVKKRLQKLKKALGEIHDRLPLEEENADFESELETLGFPFPLILKTLKFKNETPAEYPLLKKTLREWLNPQRKKMRRQGSKFFKNQNAYYFDWVGENSSKILKTQKKGNISSLEYEPLVLGITKASLEKGGFLSASSFQETIKVLTKASFFKYGDYLKGLKERVILGQLIPSGTGPGLLVNLNLDPLQNKLSLPLAKKKNVEMVVKEGGLNRQTALGLRLHKKK